MQLMGDYPVKVKSDTLPQDVIYEKFIFIFKVIKLRNNLYLNCARVDHLLSSTSVKIFQKKTVL